MLWFTETQLPSVTSKGEVVGTGLSTGAIRPVSASARLASPITTDQPLECVSVGYGELAVRILVD